MDPEKLKNTIKKLKIELDEANHSKSSKDLERSTGKSESFFITENMEKKMHSTNSSMQSQMTYDQLKSENDIMRSKVKRMEESLMQKKGAIEMD